MSDNKLCLGTVQFGLHYGINNQRGKPPKDQVFAMLSEAVKKGISWFDTAAAYGNAEELLGEFGINKYGCRVVSKLKPNLIDERCSNPEEVVEEQMKGSLQRMRLDSLEGYLLHTPENFYNPGIINGLHRCKEKGLVRNIGVSIYETQHALDAVSSGAIDYIQIPYSVFDQRLSRTEFFDIARRNKVIVFARSAFLQGLLLMEEEKIPRHLSIARQYLRDFDRIIGKYGFSRVQAAMWFSYSHPGIDYVVFGVDEMGQLLEDIELSSSPAAFQACREELTQNFVNIEKSIIFPSLWAQKRAQ